RFLFSLLGSCRSTLCSGSDSLRRLLLLDSLRLPSISLLGFAFPGRVAHGYTGAAVQAAHPRGRQASTWSARGGGGESRSRAASKNTREKHKCGLSRGTPRPPANT